MNAKLIYFYLISFVACLAASCSDIAPDAGKVGNGCELTFDVADQSRASVMTDISFGGSKFAVYGDMKFRNYDPTIIFDKTIVTYNDDKWSYNDTQYWFPKHEHSFVAVYPVDAAGMSDTQYSDSRLSFKYTLPDNFESAQDLLVATHRRKMPEDDDPYYTADPVSLKFFHILSRVNFQVKNDKAADVLKVTKIELQKINRTGDFSIAPAPLSGGSEQTDDYDSSWTGISDEGTLIANIHVDIPEDGTQPLFPDDNALFMIPQPDNKGIITKITFELWDDGEMLEERTLIAETPIGGWEQGKIYTYSITIKEMTKEIYVTVSVKDWQTPDPTDIKVPES